MARVGRLASALFMVLLLLLATGMGPAAVEGRTCMSQSHRFKGPCVRKSNCANVCRIEGFPSGSCHGFRRRCFCARPC